jgi:hypothetical protein
MANIAGSKHTDTKEKKPPLHKYHEPNATNMQTPGSDNMSHPANGTHKACNCDIPTT